MSAKAKIAVYAIARDEAKHVQRWFNSIKDADAVFVADTGSTDDTAILLQELGVHVHPVFLDPFRFDTARNFILNQIPDAYDWCLFLDLDEVMCTNWYDEAQRIISSNPDANAIHTRMIYSRRPDGRPETTYNRLQLHRRHTHVWCYPVHEVLFPHDYVREHAVFCDDLQVEHLPDHLKSRSSYFDLLELSVAESPDDPRALQYLAREYMNLGQYETAVSVFDRHLCVERNKLLRCESFRMLAACHEHLGDTKEARDALMAACAVVPDVREPWADSAAFFFRMERYYSAIGMIENMLDVTEPPQHTIIRNDAFYAEWPYHMAALCYERLGNKSRARFCIGTASRMAPRNPSVAADMVRIMEIPITNV